jgi:hypothetical protein
VSGSLYQRLRRAVGTARRVWWAARPRADENAFFVVRRRFYRDFWQQAASEAGVELTELDSDYWHARRGSAWTVVREGQIALDDHLRVRLARNKLLTARLLAPLGFQAPPSIDFDMESLDRALAFLAASKSPVVVKPDGVPQSRFMAVDGPGAGRGVTCGVRTPAELRRAARWASLFGSRLIAEKQVEGASYRLLYLDGRLIDAVRRDPPRVFGDGMSTIGQLVRAENAERRAARPPLALSALLIDLDCKLTLARQQLRLRSVPRAQQPVMVKTVSNQNASYDNHRVLDQIHPQLAELGARLVGHLGLRLAGVDVMTGDPSQALPGSFLFSEINATPGLHHHWLVARPDRRAPVGALVLEAALSPARN